MTSQQMIKLFQEILAVTAKEIGIAYTQVDTDTILNYLNEAQQKLFYEKYLSGGLQAALFSINQNLQELDKLVVTKTATLFGASSVYNKAYILRLEDNAVFPIKVIATATNTVVGSSSSKVPCNVINYQTIDRYLTNSFNIPIILKPVYLFNYGGTELDFSLADIFSFVWSNPIISQTTEENSDASQELLFTWGNPILTQLDTTEIDSTSLQFIWNSPITQQVSDIESQNTVLQFVWGNSIITQVEDTIFEEVNFIWSNSIATQIENTSIEELEFIWSNPIQTQAEDIVLETTDFSWSNSVQVQIEDIDIITLDFTWTSPIQTQVSDDSIQTIELEFAWSNTITSQVSEESLELSLDFTWSAPIITQVEDVTLETLLDFTWTAPIITQVEEPDFIGLDFEWSSLIWAETEDINMEYTDNLNFVWSNPINVQSEERLSIELISFIWSVPVLAQFVESAAELLGFEWEREVLTQIDEADLYDTKLGFSWGDEILFQSKPKPFLSALWENPVSVQVEIINIVKDITDLTNT